MLIDLVNVAMVCFGTVIASIKGIYTVGNIPKVEVPNDAPTLTPITVSALVIIHNYY